MWYRVFCLDGLEVPGDLLVQTIKAQDIQVNAEFAPSFADWHSCSLQSGTGGPIYLERYLLNEDDLRHDLNTWAA